MCEGFYATISRSVNTVWFAVINTLSNDFGDVREFNIDTEM